MISNRSSKVSSFNVATNFNFIRSFFSESHDLDLLVAGNICNTWVYDHKDAERTGQIVREMFNEQVGWAKEAGVDFIIAETIAYVGEALIALDVIKKHGLTAVITLAVLGEKTSDGYDWVEGKKIFDLCELRVYNLFHIFSLSNS